MYLFIIFSFEKMASLYKEINISLIKKRKQTNTHTQPKTFNMSIDTYTWFQAEINCGRANHLHSLLKPGREVSVWFLSIQLEYAYGNRYRDFLPPASQGMQWWKHAQHSRLYWQYSHALPNTVS